MTIEIRLLFLQRPDVQAAVSRNDTYDFLFGTVTDGCLSTSSGSGSGGQAAATATASAAFSPAHRGSGPYQQLPLEHSPASATAAIATATATAINYRDNSPDINSSSRNSEISYSAVSIGPEAVDEGSLNNSTYSTRQQCSLNDGMDVTSGSTDESLN